MAPNRKTSKAAVLRALNQLHVERGHPPTIEELREALGLGSTRTVLRYLKELEEPDAMRAFERLHRLADESKKLTLIYSAREGEPHPAQILRELLDGMRKPPTSSGPARAAASGRARASRSR